MYKQSSVADDLAESMRRELLSTEAEEHTHAGKVSSAIDDLGHASEVFDELGMKEASDIILNILQKLANRIE